MQQVHIKYFLNQHDISLANVSLGTIDFIGEYTAKKMRDKTSALWKTKGAFFRPNYERGILIYSLIKQYNLQSYLEIGFGRGFSCICAAMALSEIGAKGKATTIEPNVDGEHMKVLEKTMDPEWLKKINFLKGTSQEALPTLSGQKFDFVYIDGDHRAPAVQSDWDGVKNMWSAFCLFDDYHLPTKQESDIECAQVIDKIEYPDKQLIILDRRIFPDDRGYTDSDIDYGQVLLTNHEYLKKLQEW